jgi:LytS/YehU family sensor histidine kinase
MTLIPFIENAFKHAEHIRESGAVRINLLFENDRIYFECVNRISNKLIDNRTGGLGNELIEKRLQLLYGDSFKLNVKISEMNYQVKLNIHS